MSDSVSYNTGNIRDLANYVLKTADEYLSKIGEVTGTVEALSSDWQGETYNTFKSSYDTNKARIEELESQLKEIASGLAAVADKGDETVSKIMSRIG